MAEVAGLVWEQKSDYWSERSEAIWPLSLNIDFSHRRRRRRRQQQNALALPCLAKPYITVGCKYSHPDDEHQFQASRSFG